LCREPLSYMSDIRAMYLGTFENFKNSERVRNRFLLASVVAPEANMRVVATRSPTLGSENK
jgi:hypothetical protein